MLTREQVLEQIKSGRESECLDGRDYARLTEFFPVSDWAVLGFEPKEASSPVDPVEWNEYNVIERMKHDVAFGFKKALNQRGISAGFMHSTVETWLWVLQDEAFKHLDYAQYGLPLFKAVALKYGFPDEIPGDDGTESKYESWFAPKNHLQGRRREP
jgi:hypothetical protein